MSWYRTWSLQLWHHLIHYFLYIVFRSTFLQQKVNYLYSFLVLSQFFLLSSSLFFFSPSLPFSFYASFPLYLFLFKYKLTLLSFNLIHSFLPLVHFSVFLFLCHYIWSSMCPTQILSLSWPLFILLYIQFLSVPLLMNVSLSHFSICIACVIFSFLFVFIHGR